MGQLRPAHFVEAGLWLLAAAILFTYSFQFNQPIEIYEFGASAWPRGLILLMVIAALGQLYWQYRHGDAAAMADGSNTGDDVADDDSEHSGLRWYLLTAVMIALPFAYLRIPDLVGQWLSLPTDGLGTIKLVTAAAVIAVFATMAKDNRVGGMLGMPMLFAAMLEDFGFYSLAPFFIVSVMYLMGERRGRPMLAIMALLFAILLVLFVKILYVGLPTGNIEPFYSIGTWIVTVLQ